MQNLSHLLNQITFISIKYESISKVTGEHFNIFKLLGMASREVKTHSTFLAELLNPKGSHQQGAVFLQLFLDQFEVKDFHAPSAHAMAEHYIGPITATSGGRIDIVLADAYGKRILIENKIYAADQENQLLRYHNYDKRALLFYLTLNGDLASDLSTGGELDQTHYRCLSYKSDLLKWMERCQKEAASLPILRETLTQYIYLIKYLTNQTTNHTMQDESVQVILDKENLRSFFTMVGSYDKVINQLFINLGDSLQPIAAELGLTLEYDLSKSALSGFSFIGEELTRNNLVIRFEFEYNGAKDFFFGFRYLDPSKKSETPEQIGLIFKGIYGEETSTDSWPAWAWHEYRYWNSETYIQVSNGEFASGIKEKVQTMLEILSKA
jgi:hypothetical protein